MAADTLVETRDELWSPTLLAVRAAALDCLQANLAAVADRYQGPGTHLRLGSVLRFDPTYHPTGRPTVERTLDDHLTDAGRLLGLRVIQRWDHVTAAALRGYAADHATLYVVADAFHMRWLPYAGQRHMEHSFLLTTARDGYTVVDAYHNDTQWGAARPGVWSLSSDELDLAVRDGAVVLAFDHEPLADLDQADVLAGNAAAMADALRDVERYVTGARTSVDDLEAMEQMVLDVWLLSRSRLLHAGWLASLADPPIDHATADEQAQAWLRLASQAYVAVRRARRGGGLPASTLDELARLLHADNALAQHLADVRDTVPSAGIAADRVAAVVREALCSVLGVSDTDLAAAATLRELPNYNSFRLLDTIELVEARLNVALDADNLTADSLRDVDSLCLLFAGAPTGAGGADVADDGKAES